MQTFSILFDNYSLEALEAACREAEAKHEPEADTPYILYSSDVSLVGENKYAVTVYAWQLINGSLRLIDKFTTPSIPESYALAEFMAPSRSNLKQFAEEAHDE